MRTTSKRSALFFLIAAVLSFTGTRLSIAADNEEDGGFKFTANPIVIQPLFVDLDNDSSKFEEYRDMDTGLVIPRFRLLGESADGNRLFDFEARNVSRADERYTMRYGLSGAYRIMLDYNVIPHRFGNEATFVFSDTNPASLKIADAVQQSLQNQIETQFMADPNGVNFAFLDNLLQPFIATAQSLDLSLDRKRARAKVDIHTGQRWKFGLDLKQETRQGSRPYGGSFGFSNIVEIPEPIDYRTTSADLAFEFSGDRSGARIGARTSHFENRNIMVEYDNPFRIDDATDSNAYTAPGRNSIGGAETGRNSLVPDNTAADVYLSGRTKLGKRGWANGNVRFGIMTQDMRLLPYTSNTAINMSSDPNAPFMASDVGNLPVRNADTEVKLVNVSANAGTRLSDWGSLQFRYRYYDYDNQSSVIKFPGYVRFDAVWEDIPRVTVPYSFTSQRAGVELGWDVTRKTRLSFSYDLETWDRDFREVEGSDEDIYKVSLDTRPGTRLSLRAAYEHGDRSIDGYEVEAQEFSFQMPTGINNQPTLRKYDEAEREYDAGNVQAIIMATDSIDVTVGVTVRNDDYDESEFGLTSFDTIMYNAEVGYTPNEHLTLFVFGHRTDAESEQRARQSGGTLSTNPADDWELTLEEITDTWGLGLDAHWAERWMTRISGQWSESDGDSRFFSPPGGNPDRAQGFPEYDDNEWLVLSGRLGFTVNPNVEAGVTVAHEEFTTNRFQRNGLAPYVPGSLILNPNDGDYIANILALDLRMTF